MILQIRDDEGVVYSLVLNGTTTIRDDINALVSATIVLDSASAYVRDWLLAKKSVGSCEADLTEESRRRFDEIANSNSAAIESRASSP